MRTLLLETSGELSGDMIVGLLCDLGVLPSTFEWELAKVELGAFHLHLERVRHGESEGVHFGIHGGSEHTHEQDDDDGEFHEAHEHSHEEHDHGRPPAELRASLEGSELDDAVKERTLAIFDHFVQTETQRADSATLAFDDDNALAALSQIVCAAAGLAELGIGAIVQSTQVTEPVAAAIVAVYRYSAGTVPLGGPKVNTGVGLGAAGFVRGTISDAEEG